MSHSIDTASPSSTRVEINDYVLDTTLLVKELSTGTEVKLKDGTEFYLSGQTGSSCGVIIVPSELGWKAGRIRNICDLFGKKGLLVVVPNFSSRGVEGHTQKWADSDSLMDWHKSRTFDGNVKPVITDIVNFMRNEKVEKIALLGFAWGSWVVATLLASDMADEFHCGALLQPSIDLEEQRYGGSTSDLVSRINRPVLLMPVMGDPKGYAGFVRLLKLKLPTSTVIDYHDMESGFMLHGLILDERVQKATQKALTEIYNFFQYHFDMNAQDFVIAEVEDLGPEAEIKKVHWGQKIKEGGEKMKEYVVKTGERIKEKMHNLGESMRMSKHTTSNDSRPEDVETDKDNVITA